LQEQATIVPDDELILIPDKIRYHNSTENIMMYATQKVLPPVNIQSPSVDLIGPSENITLCKSLEIKIFKQY